MVVVDSLAAYQIYRARVTADPEAIADAAMVHEKRIILREERNFVEVVEGTFNLPSTLAGQA